MCSKPCSGIHPLHGPLSFPELPEHPLHEEQLPLHSNFPSSVFRRTPILSRYSSVLVTSSTVVFISSASIAVDLPSPFLILMRSACISIKVASHYEQSDVVHEEGDDKSSERVITGDDRRPLCRVCFLICCSKCNYAGDVKCDRKHESQSLRT